MITVKSLGTFVRMIDDMKKDGIVVKIYGFSEECGPSVSVLGTEEKMVSLNVKLAALTSVGTLYLNQRYKLSDIEVIESVKSMLETLSFTEAQISLSSQTNTITFA